MARVTIKDIAKRAGVSRGTVDRVIHNRGKVDPKIRELIEKIIDEIGYVPNPIASSLAYNFDIKTITILPDYRLDPFWEKPLEGIQASYESLKHFGFTNEILFFDLNDKKSFCNAFEKALISEPQAIIIAPIFLKESIQFFQMAIHNDIKVFTFNTEIEHEAITSFVGQNSYESGIIAGKLFDILGLKLPNIATINLGHELQNSIHIQDKLKGLTNYYQPNSNRSNLECFTFENYNNPKALSSWFENTILIDPEIKGLFFTNSRAYLLINALKDKLPKDLKIIGFDVIEGNETFLKNNAINFLLHQNPERQGQIIITQLVNLLIHKKEISKKIYLPSPIVVKENVNDYKEDVSVKNNLF